LAYILAKNGRFYSMYCFDHYIGKGNLSPKTVIVTLAPDSIHRETRTARSSGLCRRSSRASPIRPTCRTSSRCRFCEPSFRPKIFRINFYLWFLNELKRRPLRFLKYFRILQIYHWHNSQRFIHVPRYVCGSYNYVCIPDCFESFNYAPVFSLVCWLQHWGSLEDSGYESRQGKHNAVLVISIIVIVCIWVKCVSKNSFLN
jgi:hypothetical protein